MKPKQFHFLGRAVIEYQGHFLVARAIGESNTFLPGGHVETGESVPDAIQREIMEECGLAAEIGRYLGAVEHRWSEEDRENFEVNHLFQVTLPEISSFDIIESREPHLELLWAAPSQLQELNLQPCPLISILRGYRDRSEAVWASTLTNVSKTEQDGGGNG